MGSPIAEASSSPLCSFLTHLALGCIKVLSLFTHVKWQITICYSTPKSVLGDTLEFTVKMLLLQSILWQITFFFKWICHDRSRGGDCGAVNKPWKPQDKHFGLKGQPSTIQTLQAPLVLWGADGKRHPWGPFSRKKALHLRLTEDRWVRPGSRGLICGKYHICFLSKSCWEQFA